jgi:CMP-N,N'-diacetyllegionaminic acid synthase
MRADKMESLKTWAVIPARGGSKSIPGKNLVPVAGVPLLDYGVRAAQAYGQFNRILCSTDDDLIGARAKALGIEVAHRPAALATDDSRVDDAVRGLLESDDNSEPPDIVVLIQPTSPFLLPQHIAQLIAALTEDTNVSSAHTIVPCSHNSHAWNCRENVAGYARFLFPEERQRARNKQEKPKLFIFGNLIAARTESLNSGEGFYAEPAAVVEIDRPYEFDLDSPEDIAIAEALIMNGCVTLPHMS